MVLARSRVIILLLLLKLFLAHLTVVHTIYRILRKNNKFIFPYFHTRRPILNTKQAVEIKTRENRRSTFSGKDNGNELNLGVMVYIWSYGWYFSRAGFTCSISSENICCAKCNAYLCEYKIKFSQFSKHFLFGDALP